MSLALWFQRRRFLKGFYYMWAWRPSWSCDPDTPNKLSLPDPWRLHIKFGLEWPSVRRVWTINGRRLRTDGACLYFKLTYEPKGLDELTKSTQYRRMSKNLQTSMNRQGNYMGLLQLQERICSIDSLQTQQY